LPCPTGSKPGRGPQSTVVRKVLRGAAAAQACEMTLDAQHAATAPAHASTVGTPAGSGDSSSASGHSAPVVVVAHVVVGARGGQSTGRTWRAVPLGSCRPNASSVSTPCANVVRGSSPSKPMYRWAENGSQNVPKPSRIPDRDPPPESERRPARPNEATLETVPKRTRREHLRVRRARSGGNYFQNGNGSNRGGPVGHTAVKILEPRRDHRRRVPREELPGRVSALDKPW
jgi:hypothetical protein